MTPTYSKTIDSKDPADRYARWEVAKGLQAVDALETSPFLDEVQGEHVSGRYSSADAVKIVEAYYLRQGGRAMESQEAEADLVSARIVDVLGQRGFRYTPYSLAEIHGRLFDGLMPMQYAKGYRDYDIAKEEPVLAGESVEYAPFQSIPDLLRYDFDALGFDGLEIRAVKNNPGLAKLIRHIANVWQVHPFVEGNTRAVAVLTQKLLRAKGIEVDNEPLAEHALYFRNALVRANWSSIELGIEEDGGFLGRFFGNLVLGERNELRNRDLCCEELYEAKGLPSPRVAFAEHERGKGQPLSGYDAEWDAAASSADALQSDRARRGSRTPAR